MIKKLNTEEFKKRLDIIPGKISPPPYTKGYSYRLAEKINEIIDHVDGQKEKPETEPAHCLKCKSRIEIFKGHIQCDCSSEHWVGLTLSSE